MDIVWDGITRSETLSDPAIRNDLANSAKLYDWARTVAIIREYPGLVNTTRPSGKTRYAPLHQAAHGNAPLEVVQQLIDLGAWRSLQNVRGERPVDIANQKSHQFLVPQSINISFHLGCCYKSSVTFTKLYLVGLKNLLRNTRSGCQSWKHF